MRWCSLVITILTQTVSNAFEKSASTMRVTSLLYMVLNKSSRMPKRTVEDEYPLQKLKMVSPRRDFFGTEISHMGSSKLLIALDRIDSECRWSTVTWVSTFEMGLMHTSFQVCGKYSFEIKLWMIAVRRPTRCSAECFTN